MFAGPAVLLSKTLSPNTISGDEPSLSPLPPSPSVLVSVSTALPPPSPPLAHNRTESSSLQFEDTDSQPTLSPFLNPRTPPMPISGLPLYEPSQSYLGARRGSTTSTNSSLSSVSSLEISPSPLAHPRPGTASPFCQVKRGFFCVPYNVISVAAGPPFKIKGRPHLGHRNRVRGFPSLHCNYLLFPPDPLIPLFPSPSFESRISCSSIRLPRSDHGTQRFWGSSFCH